MRRLANVGQQAAKASEGLLAAREANKVFKAIVQGPPAPEPAGSGVQLEAFQKVLPWFTWRELVTFSNYFGERGTVVNDLSEELAGEVARRLLYSQRTKSSEGDREPEPLKITPREVAAVAYSFSKMKPQLPEYTPVYHAVASGILQDIWKVDRLQVALVATALADAELQLNDELLKLLRPVLQEMAEMPKEGKLSMSMDELRRLVHAYSVLPREKMQRKEVEVLAECTKQMVGRAQIGEAGHLVVSWLRLRPPRGAKEAYLEALQSASWRTSGASWRTSGHSDTKWELKHPFPRGGLASALSDLLSREDEREQPPFTPPMMRALVQSLVRLSARSQTAVTDAGRSLNLDDWAEILRLVVGFNKAHGAPSATPTRAAREEVWSWVLDSLNYVLKRIQQLKSDHSEAGASTNPRVQLRSLQILAGLTRAHMSHKDKELTSAFAQFALSELEKHHRQGQADLALVAEIIGDLVPLLAATGRAQLSRFFTGSVVGVRQAAAGPWQLEETTARLAQGEEEAAAPARRQEEWAAESVVHSLPQVTLAPPRKSLLPPEVCLPSERVQPKTQLAATYTLGARGLWSGLSVQPQAALAPTRPIAQHTVAASPVAERAEKVQLNATASTEVEAASAPFIEEAQESPQPLLAEASPADATAAVAEEGDQDLKSQLGTLLTLLEQQLQERQFLEDRLKALESKLDQKEEGHGQAREEVAKEAAAAQAAAKLAAEAAAAAETAAAAAAVSHSAGQLLPVPPVAAEPWSSSSVTTRGTPSSHLYTEQEALLMMSRSSPGSQGFVFEEYRRLVSQRNRLERGARVMPADHFPIFPLLKRK